MEQRPPFRPKVPIKCVGPYVGANDPDTKWDEIGKDVYEGGYNMISFFLTIDTPDKFYPWPVVNGKYDFSKIDQKWADYIYNMLERLAFWRVTPKLKFVDQYHDETKGLDPFRQGLGNDNLTEALYSSWDGSKYRWIQWDEPSPRKYTNFRPVNAFGRGVFLYVKTVIDAAKRVLELKENGKIKYPDFKIELAWGNETMAIFKEGNHPVKTRGDRDEVTYWLLGLAKEAGFVLNKNLWITFDYLAFRPDVRHVDYKIMGNVSKDLKKKGFRLEIHGIQDLGYIKDFTDAGVDPKTTLFSTDGDLKMTAKYDQLANSKFHYDLKVDCKPGQPFFPGNFMAFWRRYFEPYKEYIDKTK